MNKTRDLEYLLWIKSQPCIIPACRQTTVTEAHHFGPRAFTKKAPDRKALPLCMEHHRTGREAAHALGRRFGDHHRIDPQREILRLNTEYQREVA